MAERKKVVVISEECVKIASKNLPLGGLLMYQSALSASGEQASDSQNCNGHILTLLTSEELEQEPCLPGLEDILCHTPLARDARVCKAEAHRTAPPYQGTAPHFFRLSADEGSNDYMR